MAREKRAPPADPSQIPETDDMEDVEDEEIEASADPEANDDQEDAADAMVSLDDENDLPASMRKGAEEKPVEPQLAADVEPRIPEKKDESLREFLGRMDDWAPIIPDAVTHHYLTTSGLPPPPETSPQLARLLALATQKFVADLAADAYQYARIRSGHTTSNTANAAIGNLAAGLAPQPGGTSFNAVGGVGPNAAVGVGAGASQGGAGAGPGGRGMIGQPRPGYGGGASGVQGATGRTVLTMEDLGMAVGEYGINVKRGEFYR